MQQQINEAVVEAPVRENVNQNASSQINDIKRQMAELTATISKMSFVLQHTQQKNKNSTGQSIKAASMSSVKSSRASVENAEICRSHNANRMRLDK